MSEEMLEDFEIEAPKDPDPDLWKDDIVPSIPRKSFAYTPNERANRDGRQGLKFVVDLFQVYGTKYCSNTLYERCLAALYAEKDS